MAISELLNMEPIIPDAELNIDFDETQVAMFYDVFKRDFIDNPFHVDGKEIKYFANPTKVKLFMAYPESFYHLITRETISCYSLREYDCKRANRVNWIKHILLNKNDEAVKYYKWPDDKGVCKEHYYLYALDFMVVVKDIGKNKQIVTSFCVDIDKRAYYYELFMKYRDGERPCG